MTTTFTYLESLGDTSMQRIYDVVSQIKMIMQSNDISQNSVINTLDGKCTRNTILTFFKGDADCKLSTLMMILAAVGADMRIDTERSREAIISGDISEYRSETEALRTAYKELEAEKDAIQNRYSELIDKNTALTTTIEKQQKMIEQFTERMAKANEALYDAVKDIRRKDARIVELSKEAKKW